MTKEKLLSIIDHAPDTSEEEAVVKRIKEFFKGAKISDAEEIEGLDSVDDFVKNGGYNRTRLTNAPTAKSDLEKILAQLHTWNDNRNGENSTTSNQTENVRPKRRSKRTLRKSPWFWIVFSIFLLMALSYFLSFIPDIPEWTKNLLESFGITGVGGAILGLALSFREWQSDRKEKATDVSGPSVNVETNYGVVNIYTTGKEREGINERRKKFEAQTKEINLSDADTYKTYQNKIKATMYLLPRGEFRKAKNTLEKLLNVYGYTVDICMGFLRVYSKNGTTWKSQEIIKNIDTIEYLKNVNEGTNFCVESDNALYQKYIKEYGEYKENQAAKRGKKTNKCVYSVRIMQQIGIYTVLILPILLSIAVMVLHFYLPLKSFSDYTGWLFTIIYALNCLSGLTLIILWIVLAIADRNPNFEGFGVGCEGALTCICGIGIGTYICIILWGSLLWWDYLIISSMGGVYLGGLIWGLIKHKNKSITRFLLLSLLGVLWGFATYSGAVATFPSFVKSSTDYFEKNPDGTYTYVISNDKTVNLEIPSEYNGKPITKVEAEIVPSQLKSVVFPESVNEINRAILSGCGELEELTVPRVGFTNSDGVSETHGEFVYSSPTEAFEPLGYLFGEEEYEGSIAVSQPVYYTYLNGDEVGTSFYASCTFYIPATLKKVVVLSGDICYGAFSNCCNLLDVAILGTDIMISQNAFDNCTNLERISVLPAPNWGSICTLLIDSKSIEEGIYSGCENIKEAIISISAINFIPKKNLQTVTLTASSSFDVIPDEAFYGCMRLEEISLPDSVVSIGARAFAGCWSLEDIVIPNSVVSIGEEAFSWCLNLQNFVIPNSVRIIGKSAFDQCRFVRYDRGVAYVGSWAIGYNGNLSDIHFLDGTIGIANNAFENCFNLMEVAIPKSIVSIGKNAFKGCEKLLKAIFDDVEEWYVAEEWYAGGTYVPSPDLIDPQNASTYLTSTYVNCIWKRG